MVKQLHGCLFLTAALVLCLPMTLPGLARAEGRLSRTISAPAVHENLAIYFVRGASKASTVPLTLSEGMARGVFVVHETGNVNSLEVENNGSEPVFIQSGDIVKGGKQDRVLTVSLIVPPKSGRMPIDAFCVEQGRWSARGQEQVARFETSAAAMPSRMAKLAMKAPVPTRVASGNPGDRRVVEGGTSSRQSEVWKEVSRKQAQLTRSVGVPVAAAQSQTSLQLALENEKLTAARAVYAAVLKQAGESSDDIIGYVFAINGKINSGDVYESNGLFMKMWPKMLDASITEALGEKSGADHGVPPAIAEVEAFLNGAETGKASRQTIAGVVELETRNSGEAWMFDTSRASGGLVHRNYLRSN